MSTQLSQMLECTDELYGALSPDAPLFTGQNFLELKDDVQTFLCNLVSTSNSYHMPLLKHCQIIKTSPALDLEWAASNPSQDNLKQLEFVIEQAAGRNAHHIVRQFIANIFAAAISVTAGIVAIKIANRIDKSGSTGVVVGPSTAHLLYPESKQVIKNLFDSLLPQSANSVIQYQEAHRQLVDTSRNVVNCSPLRIQEAVKKIDAEVTTSLDALEQGKEPIQEPKTLNEVKAWLIIRQTFWLGQSRQRTNFLETADPEKVNGLIARQPEKQQIKFDFMVADIIGASYLGSSCGGRPLIYFHGPRGTGKSSTIKDLVKALEAKSLVFTQGDLTPEDIMGTNDNSTAYKTPTLPGAQPVFTKIKGALRDSVRQTGVTNPITSIEEFRFGELQKTPWKLSPYNLLFDSVVPEDIAEGELEDLREVIFFVVSNDHPKLFLSPDNPNREANAAFFNRFSILETVPLDDKVMARILEKSTAQIKQNVASKLGLAPPAPPAPPKVRAVRPIDPEKIAAAFEKAATIIDNSSELILQENKDLGGRTIQRVVAQLFRYVIVKCYLAAEPDYAPPKENIEYLIKQASGNK
jgi:hypothetical protein